MLSLLQRSRYSHKPLWSKKSLCLMGLLACSAPLDAKDLTEQQVKAVIDQQFKPLLAQYNIPGLAVGVSLNGQHYFVNYGVASKQTQQAVSSHTLFELGSVSKIFNATLAGYAQALSLIHI